MMVMSTKMGLCTTRADITASFAHAKLKHDEHIFVHQPAGFQHGTDLFLSLDHSVYGLCQAPH